MERWEEKERRRFTRAGAVAAAVYNTVRDSRRRPQAFGPADIFPFLKQGEADEEEAFLESFFGGLGIGKIENGGPR